jgi:hypothetical protein
VENAKKMASSKDDSAINANLADIGIQFNTLVKSSAVKRQALELYLEGLGFRSIGRFLQCSH